MARALIVAALLPDAKRVDTGLIGISGKLALTNERKKFLFRKD
jgi:hypothetical protein